MLQFVFGGYVCGDPEWTRRNARERLCEAFGFSKSKFVEGSVKEQDTGDSQLESRTQPRDIG